MRRRLGATMTMLALLAGCGGGDEMNSGGVTADESRQLNEAAEMLDASPDSLIASEETELGNGEAAAADAPPAANGQ